MPQPAITWRTNAEKSLAQARAELRLLRDPSTRDGTAKEFRLSGGLVDSYIATLEAQERRLVRDLTSQR